MSKSMEYLDLDKIVTSKTNPRKRLDEKAEKDLLKSVKIHGIIQPILVRPVSNNSHYEIVAGERRYRAALAAKLIVIPAIIKEMDDKTALEMQVIENLQRADLHPLEEAEGYETLIKKHGYSSAEDVAAKVGKSRSYVYGRMKLCDLVPENRRLFYDGKFSPSVALLVARIPAHLQKEAGKELIRDTEEGEIVSYREAQRYILHNCMLQLTEAPFDTKDKTLTLGETCGSCLDCPKRTGNQKELFPDISSADVCTDPACFGIKKNAFVQRTLAKLKESGKKILSQEQAKKIFPNKYNDYAHEDYISLDDSCYDDSKSRKFRQLAKSVKDAEIIYVVHPHKGTLVELITKTEAARIKKQLGIKGRNNDNSQQTHDMAKARLDERIRKAAIGKIAEAIIAKVRLDKDMTFLRFMARAELRAANEATQRMFILRRDPTLKRDQVYNAMIDHLKAISDSELLGFCLELLMLAQAEWNGFGETATSLCQHYKIDIKEFSKQAVNEIKTKSKKTKSVKDGENGKEK